MKQLTAKDVMNPHVIAVREDMTLHELATLLTEHGISGAPVLNQSGKLVGVVSVTDIALTEAERASIESEPPSSSFYSDSLKQKLNREDLRGLHVENEGLRRVDGTAARSDSPGGRGHLYAIRWQVGKASGFVYGIIG